MKDQREYCSVQCLACVSVKCLEKKERIDASNMQYVIEFRQLVIILVTKSSLGR